MTTRGRGWVVAMLAAIAWLAIARPWTIRPIAEEPRASFDAGAYAARIWDARVVPAIRAGAVPFAAFQGRPATHTAAVWLTGVVARVNTDSRVGTASIDAIPTDGHVDAVLMIGPVLRGTALRDALDFVRFTDFTNQIEFAAVANALNDRVLATALKGVTPEALAGRQVRLLGVAWRDEPSSDIPAIVPVELSIGEAP